MFVIDTTGSMGKDIAAVQTKTAEIVRETQGTASAPYNYILVTFNDPGIQAFKKVLPSCMRVLNLECMLILYH